MARLLPLLIALGCAEPPPPPPAPTTAGPLYTTHADLLRAIGGHRMLGHSRIRMSDGAELIEDWTLEADGRGNWRLEHINNHELGKEAVLVEGVLYTRHRYGTFLSHPPERGESDRLREEAWNVLAAYLDMLHPWLDVRREGDRLVLRKAARRRHDALPETDRPERAWRDTVLVQDLSGWVLLDGDLATDAELHARYSFRRDKIQTSAELDYTRYLTRGSPTIAVPEAIPTPVRRRLEPERQKLLGEAGEGGGP